MRLRRNEGGFGLVELIIAMTVLNIGLLALVGALNSGALALSRASRLSTAAALAEAQMELYRSLTYVEIRVDDGRLALADATYLGDSAWNAALDVNDSDVRWTSCGATIPRECNPSAGVTGPDGNSYRVDTYIVEDHPGVTAGGSTVAARDVKYVTVVVRDATNLAKTFVRQQSTFDQSAG